MHKITSSSFVAGPRVPPPAFNRHPVQFILWPTPGRDFVIFVAHVQEL
jgi:hypothetical protein